MAETLLALLLVASSGKGSSLVYWWPPTPQASSRLARPLPTDEPGLSQYDNAWIASNSTDMPRDGAGDMLSIDETADDEGYEWKRPDSFRDRSISFSKSTSRSTSRPGTPFNDDPYIPDATSETGGYNNLFDFSPQFLANLLCPQDGLCHQKFELIVDNLAFIGHPVSAENDGIWRFKSEKTKTSASARGREYRSQRDDTLCISPRKEQQSYPLHTFHFVLVLDLPDPSSAAAGNVSKYFDIIYEQIALTFTAVLFQEQVLSNFVAVECDALTSLKEDCVARGLLASCFAEEALKFSSIASSMKILFEAIKASSIACMTIHDHPLDLQLPPYLDFLLHSEEEDGIDNIHYPDDDGETELWGPNMSIGWRLPTLAPWKALLLLDGHNVQDLSMDLNSPQANPEDRALAEGLIGFLEIASVTIPLSEMADLLGWDLETQVIPTVRWLVYHRKAKVVDVVHPKLKTVFALPPKFDAPLTTLTSDFEKEFGDSCVPPLLQVLSAISTTASKQSDFFSSVVRSKDLIPLYHNVILWMLQRDMLITLHLRIRVVATRELKIRVRTARERARARRIKASLRNTRKLVRQEAKTAHSAEVPSTKSVWLSFFPDSGQKQARKGTADSGVSTLSELVIKESEEETIDEEAGEDEGGESGDDDDDGEEENLEEDQDEQLGDKRVNYIASSMISDPSRATPLERRWLSAMSDGKDASVAERFDRINQFFDGMKTADEILYRAAITRRQLREVLHYYEEYLQTFLHPS